MGRIGWTGGDRDASRGGSSRGRDRTRCGHGFRRGRQRQLPRHQRADGQGCLVRRRTPRGRGHDHGRRVGSDDWPDRPGFCASGSGVHERAHWDHRSGQEPHSPRRSRRRCGRRGGAVQLPHRYGWPGRGGRRRAGTDPLPAIRDRRYRPGIRHGRARAADRGPRDAARRPGGRLSPDAESAAGSSGHGVRCTRARAGCGTCPRCRPP